MKSHEPHDPPAVTHIVDPARGLRQDDPPAATGPEQQDSGDAEAPSPADPTPKDGE